jgi:uracil-DNA glycosylase
LFPGDFVTLTAQQAIAAHIEELKTCSKCPLMIGPVVTHRPVLSKVYLIGQAPGPREGGFGRPFAWTAGKTLFRWFSTIGLDEEQFRSLTYMSAVCRCFPGKASGGGDRVPSTSEIENCEGWMAREFQILQPTLVIPVGRLAIERSLGKGQLVDLIGRDFTKTLFGVKCDVIPLPHPSGASTWFKREPGITLLQEALAQISRHPAWHDLLTSKARVQETLANSELSG